MLSNTIRPDYNALKAAYDIIYNGKGSDEEKEKALAFARLYGEVDDPDETQEERNKRLQREIQLASIKRERMRKINQEAARIARLREKLFLAGDDPAIKAEISEAQTMLLWLLHPM